jgi:hypothetical protein
VYGILCDGASFQFFLFDGSTKPPSFYRGTYVEDLYQRGLRLADFTETDRARSFIRSLRIICETIFDLLLHGYISSVKAYRDRSNNCSPEHSKPRKSLDKWDEAVSSANEALEKFRDAEMKRLKKDRAGANALVREAQTALKLR